VTFFLDTNACIALINGTSPQLRRRFRRAVAGGRTVAVSSVVAFELWYGVAKSARRQDNAKRLATFFAGPVDLIAFDDADARSAGEVRAALEAAGTPFRAYDVLIAGQALRRRLTLVTADVREFARVAGLAWRDWASQR
jgi:tRNA(fMet)-specific endonuclease VapC